MNMKQIISLLLSFVMVLGMLSGCGNNQPKTTDPAQNTAPSQTEESSVQNTTEPDTTEPVVEEQPETIKAREMGLIPAEWDDNLSVEADFAGFNQLMTSLITVCDESALSIWNENVDTSAFPQRNMRRDDGLVLLMLAAESLGWNVYNAREYEYCTEEQYNFGQGNEQFSWDYPYCDAERETTLFFGPDDPDEPLGNVPGAALYWMQRRMDLSQRVHFFDHNGDLNFHFDQQLTREAAIAAVVRLYNSETLGYYDYLVERVPTEADEALFAEVETVKQAILNNMDDMPCEGTAYYVSNHGNDENDGLSPETAWASLEKASVAELNPGDGVYFERGGLWRGQLIAQDGVIYSAYGEGEKPKLYASPENGADPGKWLLLEGTDNIWVYHMDMMDCGALVFNDGENWAVKVTPYYDGGYLSTIHEGQPFDVETELTEDLMFFSEVDSIIYENGKPFPANAASGNMFGTEEECIGTLYLRCDAGNPGEVFDSIEFMVRRANILCAEDNVFHNLCLKYTGDMGIAPNFANTITRSTVSFCEMGWMGGSIASYESNFTEDGTFSPGGGALILTGNIDYYSVTDCYFYQHLDAAMTHQDTAPDEERGEIIEPRLQQNITYARNIVEYTDMPVEIFYDLKGYVDPEMYRMKNVLVEGNYFLYTGYGWASKQYNKEKDSAAYQGHAQPNAAENFRIINNVFYLSTGSLINTGAPKEWQPVLDGNTYVQHEGGVLAYWTTDDGYGHPETFIYESATALDIIYNILGDENGVILED